jgi:hypothetical protein
VANSAVAMNGEGPPAMIEAAGSRARCRCNAAEV